jgi:hypothetical protein
MHWPSPVGSDLGGIVPPPSMNRVKIAAGEVGAGRIDANYLPGQGHLPC